MPGRRDSIKRLTGYSWWVKAVEEAYDINRPKRYKNGIVFVLRTGCQWKTFLLDRYS